MIPPEASPRKGMSCWTIGLLSCLGAVALIVIGVALLFVFAARQPEVRQLMSVGVQMGQCQQNMQEIYAAIERYRQRNDGKYPANLQELVPRYLSEAGRLKCPADTSNKPTSYIYQRPAPDAPDTTPLLTCENHAVAGQKVPLIVFKNGQFARVTPTERAKPQSPTGTGK